MDKPKKTPARKPRQFPRRGERLLSGRVSETPTINVYEAKARFSELIDRAAGGEEIVVAKAGKPVARIVPLPPARPRRVPGLLKGKIWVADDFDDPLPPEIQKYFDDPQIFPPDYDDDGNPR